MVMVAEPAYASAGPIRADRRAADRRRGAAALLTAVTSGLAATRTGLRPRALRGGALSLVRARSPCATIRLRRAPNDVFRRCRRRTCAHRARLGGASIRRGRSTAGPVRCSRPHAHRGPAHRDRDGRRRRAAMRARGDGAAPLIGSSPAIRAVRERIERVAATDFTVLIEGASGPQPHPNSIEVSSEAAVH